MGVLAVPRRAARSSRRAVHGISYRRQPSFGRPTSQACTFAQLESPEYAEWCRRLELPVLHHRKTWEWCFILRVLERADMLRPGRTGLGFGVGREPITAYAANQGCEVLATDAPAEGVRSDAWRETGQLAEHLGDLNYGELCPVEVFTHNVSFRPVDMRAVPDDLGTFDFTWSSCAMEHLGDLDAGLDFFERQLDCLKPGGIGVHTTEFNVDPYGPTLAEGHTVIYQRGHLESLTRRMRKQGHRMKSTFALGDTAEDLHVDVAPFTNVHIRIKTYNFVHTSFGLVVRKR
jgi:hypothetical protein